MPQAAEVPGTLEVGSYLRQGLDHMRGRVRAKTHEGYEGLIRLYALPHLEGIPLTELRGQEVLGEVDEMLSSLDSEMESLDRSEIDGILSLAEQLRSSIESRHPKYLRELPDRLEDLAVLEGEQDPHSAAFRILFPRRPEFLLFGEDDRTLQSTYDLEEVADDPPQALVNLAGLAGLDLVEARDAARAGEWGRVESLERAANEELEQLFHESWRQAAITVRLRMDATTLRILVETVPGQYDSIADRSDGLRWFIALLAYTETYAGDVRPILLVDEAETHLHYDGQADLVRVFARQQAAAKIIYTTHSAGCLPEDLGAAIRVVAPVPDTDRSQIRNWFWEEEPGFSPLFLGMGASALAFTAMRRAVVAEGVADLILLPSILRDATGRSELGFQVAPGLAEVSPEAVKELELVAARVAYVVDGDAGGRRAQRKLKRQGVPTDLIVEIRDRANGYALEDLLDRDTYLKAVNEELRRSHGEEHQIQRNALPNSGRPGALETWCRKQGIKAPSKRAVANRVLERDVNESLVAKGRRALVQRVYADLAHRLGVEVASDR